MYRSLNSETCYNAPVSGNCTGTTQNQSLTRDAQIHKVEDDLLDIVNMHEIHTAEKLNALELGNVQIECINVHDSSNELHLTEIQTNSILEGL